ncbi:MAG: amidohydrolase family protein [Oscillospiraceae bacterium]|nr:amidohydrolase family protein [Oscillospiraceae bacterium]
MKLLIQNGTVIDPASGVHAVRDVWIDGGRISDPAERADTVIDASGKIVCPGLIDIHMHEDPVDDAGHLEAFDERSVFACMLHMGVTTAVAGNCGENKYHPADYLDLVDRDGAPVNVAMLAGHGWFRHAAGCTDRYAPATPEQRSRMTAGIEEALQRGCLGVSFGIRYEPGMDARELTETAGPCRKQQKLISAHIRDDAAQVFAAAREYLDAGLRLDVPIQISHIGSMAGFGQMEAFLRLVDGYRRDRPDICCDCYPYDAFSTSLGSTTYDEGWLERYGCGYDVLELCMESYAGQPCTEALFRRVRAEHPDCMTVCHVMRQADVDLAYRHEAVMVASDATLDRGQGHPRACGTFPRVLSRYVCGGVLSMDDAIRRMTALPAWQLGLTRKGRLSAGADADVLIFDPERIQDNATFSEPLAPPSGIEWVLIGGKPVLRDGVILDRRAGRSVRG